MKFEKEITKMPNYNKKLSETAVRIGEVRFGYVNVFKPRSNDDGTEKYSVQLLIPKSDAIAKKMIDEAIEAAANSGVSSKWDGKRPAKLKLPLRDGDEKVSEDKTYEGMWFMNCSSNADNKPGVAVLENGQVVEALDGDDFYSGCYGCASINFNAYNTKGNKGVGAYLNNVIKTRDGERLAGGHTAEEDFADLVGDVSGLLD
jgi:hypothetical protein